MKEQNNSRLMQAYERLHNDYQYLENEHEMLKEQAALQDSRIKSLERRLWVCQLERERYKDEAAALRRKG